MWRDVFLANKEAVLEMLGTFNEDLSKLTRAIRRGDGEALFEHFTRTRAIRRGIVEIGQDSAAPDFGRPHAQLGQEAGVSVNRPPRLPAQPQRRPIRPAPICMTMPSSHQDADQRIPSRATDISSNTKA